MATEAGDLRQYNTWFVIYGVVLAILGIFAIAAPGIASVTAAIFVGWLLLIGGIVGIVAAFSGGTSMPGFWWHLLTAAVYALAGLLLLWRPIAGVLTLTVILTAYLLVGGVARIILAFGYRDSLPGAWGWVLVSGIIDLLLAFVIIANWPVAALQILGLLVGINLLMMGVSIAIASWSLRSAGAQTA